MLSGFFFFIWAAIYAFHSHSFSKEKRSSIQVGLQENPQFLIDFSNHINIPEKR